MYMETSRCYRWCRFLSVYIYMVEWTRSYPYPHLIVRALGKINDTAVVQLLHNLSQPRGRWVVRGGVW